MIRSLVPALEHPADWRAWYTELHAAVNNIDKQYWDILTGAISWTPTNSFGNGRQP
jgi:hypothetical protein